MLYVVIFRFFVLFEDFFSTEFRMIKLLFLSVSCLKGITINGSRATK